MYQWTDERYNPAVVARIQDRFPLRIKVRHIRDERTGVVTNWRQHSRWNRAAGQRVWHDQVKVVWDIPSEDYKWVPRGARESWVDVANVEVI